MFKSATIYRTTTKASEMPDEVLRKFVPCQKTDEQTSGWVLESPHDLFHPDSKQILVRYGIETKKVPTSTWKRLTQEGKSSGKCKDVIYAELLAQAIPVRKETFVWFDFDKGRVVIDSTSPATLKLVYEDLIRLGMRLEAFLPTAGKLLTDWFADEPPGELFFGDTCKLSTPDLTYVSKQAHNQRKDIDKLLENGAEVVSAALYDEDLAVSFTLKQYGDLSGIVYPVKMPKGEIEGNFLLVRAHLGRLLDALDSVSGDAVKTGGSDDE